MTSRTAVRLIFAASALLWIGAISLGGWQAFGVLLATSAWFTLVAVGGMTNRGAKL